MYGRWSPYVSVGQRRRQTTEDLDRSAKAGRSTAPVIIKGLAIARTAWGKAWCANVERYGDYANRLPRGRTYARNGSVIDLQVAPGQVVARVSGSSIYQTTVAVQAVPKAKWQQICADCAGGIDSLVELLQGRFSKALMDRLCRQGDGLFPSQREITFDCSCPDNALMCKHVAAVLYGVGARLDQQPELLFTLRQVDAADLLSKAGGGLVTSGVAGKRTLAEDDLSALFGLDMGGDTTSPEPANTRAKRTLPPSKVCAQITPPAPARPERAAKPEQLAAATAATESDPTAHLLAALRSAGWLDNASARAVSGLDADSVRALLKRLVADGHAREEGQRRATRYVAVSPPAPTQLP